MKKDRESFKQQENIALKTKTKNRSCKATLWLANVKEFYEKYGYNIGYIRKHSKKPRKNRPAIIIDKQNDNYRIMFLTTSGGDYNYTFDLQNCYYSIIFTASRHGKMETVKKHIELTQNMLNKNGEFKNWFAGFDLAGAEASKSPEEFREIFLPLMEQCLNITIHAGEGENAENIWKAVYHLNADRIGHGLTLKDKPELMNRFIDRKIAVEMCPSSNYQIVGFKDYNLNNKNTNIYPLKEYLDKGIYVTINTDDPGISLTNLTQEYYKAASMTKDGLSKWDMLKIVRNGFRSAFLSFDKRKELLINAEKEIAQLIMKTELNK